MIFDCNKPRKIQSQPDYTRGWKLMPLSFATSIKDLAFVYCVRYFSSVLSYIFVMVWIIGLTEGIMTVISILLGECLSNRFERKSDVLAGFVLIGIGLQILLKHLDVNFCS